MKLNRITDIKVIKYFYNRVATWWMCRSTLPRPNTYSLKSDAPALSFISLVDKTFFARHAQSHDASSAPFTPDIDSLLDLHCRKHGEEFLPGRSNLLFMFFAQWFTDGFFRSNHYNARKTDSRHDIDLCQIYGSNDDVTRLLRSKLQGKLKVDIDKQDAQGKDYPPKLYCKNSKGKYELKEEFENLPYNAENYRAKHRGKLTYLEHLSRLEGIIAKATISEDDIAADKPRVQLTEDQKGQLVASGLDRGNSTVGHRLLNTLFLREHNRICDELIKSKQISPEDDEVLFQTARSINTILLTRLVIEEYINHISGRKSLYLDLDKPKKSFQKKLSWFEKKNWYREPWVSAEFNLLYRWHGLVPDMIFNVNEHKISFLEQQNQFQELGFDAVLNAALTEPAGNLTIGHTPYFLRSVEAETIQNARDWKFRSYNHYRSVFGMTPLKSFDQLTVNKHLAEKLSQLYGGDINKLELITGLFAESPSGNELAGELMTRMVAYDAFTQIYPNPLLANKNYHFVLPQIARDIVEKTDSLYALVKRNSNLTVGRENVSFAARPNVPPASVEIELSLEKFNKILCPNLRIGVRLGQLNPDKDGWVSSKELKAYLSKIGVKDPSIVMHVLVSHGEKQVRLPRKGYVNITGHADFKLDHGSSTCILNNEKGFSQSQLDKIKSLSCEKNRLYIEDFEEIAEYTHLNFKKKQAQFSGQVLQILEFETLLKIFGKNDGDGRRYLTKDDLDRIWRESLPPKHWVYPVKKQTHFSWVFKTVSHAILRVIKRK